MDKDQVDEVLWKKIPVVEKGDLLASLYKQYHRLWWCHLQHYRHFKCKATLFNALALLLAAVGMITAEVFARVEIVVILTALATLLKGWTDFKRFGLKMDMTKFAYTTYAKTLIELERIARAKETLEDDQYNQFLLKMTVLNEIITDFVPCPPRKILEKYPQPT